jgi:hypothetical protein
MKRMIAANALRKGLLGGSPLWRFVWFVGLFQRLWSRVSKSGDAPVVFSQDLPEGEVIVISHSPERSRRGRGEGRTYLIGPKRRPPRISSAAAGVAYAAAKKAIESSSQAAADDRPAA